MTAGSTSAVCGSQRERQRKGQAMKPSGNNVLIEVVSVLQSRNQDLRSVKLGDAKVLTLQVIRERRILAICNMVNQRPTMGFPDVPLPAVLSLPIGNLNRRQFDSALTIFRQFASVADEKTVKPHCTCHDENSLQLLLATW